MRGSSGLGVRWRWPRQVPPGKGACAGAPPLVLIAVQTSNRIDPRRWRGQARAQHPGRGVGLASAAAWRPASRPKSTRDAPRVLKAGMALAALRRPSRGSSAQVQSLRRPGARCQIVQSKSLKLLQRTGRAVGQLPCLLCCGDTAVPSARSAAGHLRWRADACCARPPHSLCMLARSASATGSAGHVTPGAPHLLPLPTGGSRRQQRGIGGSRRNNMPSVLGRPMRSPGPHATAPFMRDGQLCERRA